MTYSRGLDRPRRIFLAVPTYSGQVGAGFMVSLFESQAILHAAGIGIDLCTESGNCHVDDARNTLVRQFLQTDCSDLVFLDADVAWQGEDLLKLISYDRDVVAGVYPKKQEETDFPVLTLAGPLQADPESNYELVEVEGAPTGFLRISRKCLLALQEKSAAFMSHGAKPNDPPFPLIFERIIQDGRRMSGDYAFCWKWRKLGGKIWVAPEMYFGHEGQSQWSGRLGDFWRQRAGLESPQLRKGLDMLRAGNDAAYGVLCEAWGNSWAAGPELLAACYSMALSAKGPILETGSGLTTLVMAVAAEKSGQVVHALESSLKWRARVQAALNSYGLIAMVHYAPLASYPSGAWYDLSRVVLPDAFGLVLCDGPSRKESQRDILFGELGERFGDAPVLLDDAGDLACLAPFEAWSTQADRKMENLGPFALSYKEK